MPDCEHSDTVSFIDEGRSSFHKRLRRWTSGKLTLLAELIYPSMFEQRVTVRYRNGKELADLWVSGDLYGKGVKGAFGFAQGESDNQLIANLPYGMTVTVSRPYAPQPCSCHED